MDTFRFIWQYLGTLPILYHKQKSAAIAAEVKKLLALNLELVTATDLRATQLADRTAHVVAKVDGLVFELYGLSAGEVGVVEGRDERNQEQ